jgi:lysophospholipase
LLKSGAFLQHRSCSYDTFQFAYTGKETQIFLDQVHSNTIRGFTPNSNSPDPNWGKCLQCAAVDRARLKQNVTSRSSICRQCFSQYCYDPLHPPSSSELPPNRKFVLVDPDPQGLSQITTFLSAHKGPLIGGLVGFLLAIGVLTGILCVYLNPHHPSTLLIILCLQISAAKAQAGAVQTS